MRGRCEIRQTPSPTRRRRKEIHLHNPLSNWSLFKFVPIVPSIDDPTSLMALTPSHFLVGTDLLAVWESSVVDITSKRLHRWRQIQQTPQIFWKRWREGYLSQLEQRSKWYHQLPNIGVNKMVVVQDGIEKLAAWAHRWSAPRRRQTEYHVNESSAHHLRATWKWNIITPFTPAEKIQSDS